jgi:hypothetical protein
VEELGEAWDGTYADDDCTYADDDAAHTGQGLESERGVEYHG